MNIRFKKVRQGAETPDRCYEGSAGHYVRGVEFLVDTFSNTVSYHTGIQVDVPRGTFLDVRAESDLSEIEWALVASTVECGDHSEIVLVFRPLNHEIDVRSEKPYPLGCIVGNLILIKHQKQDYEEVEKL
jgi:dUTPase